MPNWCSNGLTLRHEDPAMIKRAADALNRGEFFQEFVPVPEDLKITAGYLGDTQEQKKLEEQTAANQAKYGYGNWYDFCVSEWGTKWDASVEPTMVDVDEDGLGLRVPFDTAWAPPIGFYEKIEGLGFTIEAYYYESGCGFVGVYRDGYDECYDISGLTSDTVRDAIGEELDDYWCISENMAEWEAMDRDDVTAWYEDGVEKKGLEPHK